MRKRHSQEIQDAFGGVAVRSDDIFIKENKRLNVVFMKIICPAVFVSHDPFIPGINYVEAEAGCGVRLRFLALFLTPDTCLACNCPGDCLLDAVPAAHPNILRLVENGGEKLRPGQILVCGNFLQHFEHSVEITPHYNKAEDSTGRSVSLQNTFDICDPRWSAPACFPGFSGLGQKILIRRAGNASTSEDAAKQVRTAALNRSNDVRDCRFHLKLPLR